MTLDEAVELARAMREHGAGTEEILSRLRASGATIMESIKVIRRIEGADLARAKEIIDGSEAWADRREATEQARKMAFRAAQEEGAQQDPP